MAGELGSALVMNARQGGERERKDESGELEGNWDWARERESGGERWRGLCSRAERGELEGE